MYPGARTLESSVHGEDNGENFIEDVAPTAAHAAIRFTTLDTPDRVISWYDAWLKAHGWEDARNGAPGRTWQRGSREQVTIDVPTYLHYLPKVTYDYSYRLLSSRFAPLPAAASPITDPVGVEAVDTRDAGVVPFAYRFFAYGSAEATAEEQRWSSDGWIRDGIRMAKQSDAESTAPRRAAYRLETFQVPEYENTPQKQGDDPPGYLITVMRDELYQEGFLQISAGHTTLKGVRAVQYTYARGDREVYELAVGYGPDLSATYNRTVNNPANGQYTAKYRVATISLVYSILPKMCRTTDPDCVALAPAPDLAVGP